MDLKREHHNLLFGVRRSVRYHLRRRAFYERLHAGVLFLALVFGSATIATFGAELGKDWPLWVKLLPAALTSVLSAADLVVGSSRKAWLHSDLARKFFDLEREIERARWQVTEELVIEITDRRLAIEADEPPVLRVLDTLCHNELMRAMGYPRDQEIRVDFVQRLFANFFEFREATLHA